MIALAIALAGMSVPSAAVAIPPCLKRPNIKETNRVRVAGKIIYRMFYGPPGYGDDPKTDRRMRVAIMRLDKPIILCAANQPSRSGRRQSDTIREIQISSSRQKLRSGKRYTLVGSIDPATQGPEFLDYVFFER